MKPSLGLSRCAFALGVICAAGGIAFMWWFSRTPNWLLLTSGIIALAGLGATLSPKVRADGRLEGLSFFAIFSLFLAFYAATNGSQMTPYNAHVLQAYAFTHGHIWIDAPPHIEHARVGNLSYELHPLLPAFLLVPFAAIWGLQTNQTYFSIVFGALDVALAWRLLAGFELTTGTRLWLTMFFGLGTIVWYEAINGSSWEVSMIVAIGFTLLALGELFGAAQPLYIGFFVGLAALSRYDLAFAWPFYMVLVYRRRLRIVDVLALAPGLAATLIIYVLFDEIRYHSLLDRGAFIYASGMKLFGIEYLLGNIYTLFFMAPSQNNTFPYFHPIVGGQALTFTSPAFILTLRASLKSLRTWIIGLAALVTMTPSLLFVTNGLTQFGTRHYLHAFPFLLVLMALGTNRVADQLMKILIVMSIVLIGFGVWHVHWYGFG